MVYVDSRKGETGLETVTFFYVGNTSPGYGHVINRTYVRTRILTRAVLPRSTSHGCSS